MKLFAALICGVVFGSGIVISGMSNPAKVINFFDVAGTFDASLLLVMGSALATTFVGYRLLFGARAKPLLDEKYALPTSKIIDAPLVLGSIGFGVGWGITGFCPGGAIPALGFMDSRVVIFLAAMLAGMWATRTFRDRQPKTANA